tara:strand:+ start:2325 stop:3464 length:1140 start_codon:yes stop_codon:yes gene_type:complete
MATKVSDISKKELVTPSKPNETQDSKENTHHKVLVSDCHFYVKTDRAKASLITKDQGHGFNVFYNGDINIQTGSPKQGYGKLNIASHGGQIVNTGPVVVERTGSSKSPGQGEGSSTSTNAVDDIDAYHEINWGNAVSNTHGSQHIIADHLVLEGISSLTLKSGGEIFIEGAKLISNTGSDLWVTDAREAQIAGRDEVRCKEDVLLQTDPRASTNIIGLGHINRFIKGDYKTWIGGVSDQQYMGGPPTSLPLVKNRTAGLNIGVKLGNLLTTVTAGSLTNITGAGAMINTVGGLYTVTAGLDISVSSPKGIGIAAGLDMPGLDAGKLTLTGLNSVGVSATTGTADITGNKGVNVTATTGDAAIKAPAGKVDLDGLYIYLN